MSGSDLDVEVRTALLVRATFPDGSRGMSRAIGVIGDSGGPPIAHLSYRLAARSVGLFLCERPEEAALALRAAGVTAETETAVVVRVPDRPGLVRHLLRSLEAEGIEVGFAWSAAAGGEAVAIFRTSSNPVAEEVLRSYFDLPDPSPAPGSERPDQSARGLS